MEIKKTLSENRTLLNEAVAVLRLIDHAEEADAPFRALEGDRARRFVKRNAAVLGELASVRVYRRADG